jgi:hypothetical protein
MRINEANGKNKTTTNQAHPISGMSGSVRWTILAHQAKTQTPTTPTSSSFNPNCHRFALSRLLGMGVL